MRPSILRRSSIALLALGSLVGLSAPLSAKSPTNTPGVPVGASSSPGPGANPNNGGGSTPATGKPAATDPLATPLPKGVNINSASLEDLLRLPGITSQRAQAIMRNRPYAQIDDLVKKKVLKTSTFEHIKPYIVVN